MRTEWTGTIERFPGQAVGRGVLALALMVAAACGGSGGGGGRGGPARPGAAPAPDANPRTISGPQFDAIGVFRRMGLLARGTPMPFVGSVSFFAASTPDSTHALVAVSIANASLTFARENDRFRAGYTVTITLRNGPTVVRTSEAHEAVVVTSFKETTRGDESVLYEEIVTVPPGRYDFTVTVRDDGSARTTEDAATLVVPAVATTGLSTPVAFARAAVRSSVSSLPQVLINPTASGTFGQDSVIPFFVESYGDGEGARRLRFDIRTDNGRILYQDSTTLNRRGGLYAGTISVPISRVAIGAMALAAWIPGRADTVRAPLFVGFGGDLPVASFEDMLNYLRWFAAPYRLQSLRDTVPEQRSAAWAAFVRDYANANGTGDALRDYFSRLFEANTRFREETTAGWMTDRGRVLLGLGRPDQVYEQIGRSLSQQGRTQIWEYRNQGVTLTFYDQNGFGRWRLTNTSETEFLNAWRRRVR
jgi:GWxTD domain-containing protein